jgi:hypothetical protein
MTLPITWLEINHLMVDFQPVSLADSPEVPGSVPLQREFAGTSLFCGFSLPHTQRPAQAIPAATETTKAIRTAGPAGMQAAAAAQEATTTSSSMEVTFPWDIPKSVILW